MRQLAFFFFFLNHFSWLTVNHSEHTVLQAWLLQMQSPCCVYVSFPFTGCPKLPHSLACCTAQGPQFSLASPTLLTAARAQPSRNFSIRALPHQLISPKEADPERQA